MQILYGEMQKENRKTGGLFNSAVQFHPEGINFNPDDKEISESL